MTQSSSVEASPSDGLSSYPRHLLECSYPSAEMQLYSTASIDLIPYLEGREQSDPSLFQEHEHEMKCKQLCPGFELRSLIPFPIMLIIKLSTPPSTLYGI